MTDQKWMEKREKKKIYCKKMEMYVTVCKLFGCKYHAECGAVLAN